VFAVIFSLQVGLTSSFVPDYQIVKLCSKSGFREVFLTFMTVILTLIEK